MAQADLREPVRRRHRIEGAAPRQVYDVVVDFAAYPRLFPEFKETRVLSVANGVSRVEFRAQVVLAVRYVLDLACNPDAPAVSWTYVEGEIVTGSVGSWRFTASGGGTDVEYTASLDVKAPLPGFVLRKVTDGLVSASLPSMFASIEREVRRRQAAAPKT
jgi:ribosome-associated toxin RatA of RatAB toxin-antitoxin module